MTKEQLFKRALPIAISFIAIILLAFSCSALKTNTVEPKLSNPNDDFAHLGSIAVSNEEVYQSLIDNYGALELSNLVDTDLLTNGTKNYIELAKNDSEFNIEEEVQKSMFNGKTLEEAKKSFTEEQIQDLEENFYDSLPSNGYNTVDEFKEKLYLNRARKLYARDAVMQEYNASPSDEPSIAIGDLKSHYEKKYYDEACVVRVKFSTLDDAMNSLIRAGLDINTDGEVVRAYYKDGTYVSPDDINNYPLDPDVLKTLEVTDEEILETYVNIYNERYAYRTPLTYSNGSILECGSEDVTYNFEEVANKSTQLADYMFRLLDTERNTELDPNAKPYSAEPVNLPYAKNDQGSKNAFFIMYKVSGDNQKVFRDLFEEMTDEQYVELLDKKPSDVDGKENQALLDELLDRVVKSYSAQQSIYNEKLQQLRYDHELTIYDSFLKLNFETSYGQTVPNKGDNEVVYSYIDQDGSAINVTADDFYETMSNKYGAAITISLMNTEMALNDDELIDSIVTSDKKDELKKSITQYKLNFQQGAYQQYGFDPTQSTWKDFMYQAFKVRSEAGLYNSLVKSEVVREFQKEMYNTEELQQKYYDLMVEHYQDSFEIDIMHFLVYADNDENGTPDYILEGEDNWTEYQHEMAIELIDMLRVELDDVMNTVEVTQEALNDVVSEYNEASLETDENSEDYSKWAKYKKAGLYIKVEDLGEVTQNGFEEPFENEARSMYDEMIAEDLSAYISPNDVTTRYGYHLMYSGGYSEKGDAYPEDDTLVFPSKEDIEKYKQNDVEQSYSAMVFIERYYKPVRDKYITQHEIVINDNERAKLGEIQFVDSNIQNKYNDILEANERLVERNS